MNGFEQEKRVYRKGEKPYGLEKLPGRNLRRCVVCSTKNNVTKSCVRCEKFASDTPEKCPHSPSSTPKIRLEKFSKKSNSYELFSDEMESNRTGEVNCKIYSEGRETLTKSKPSANAFYCDKNVTDTPSPKFRQSSQTPEYVKKTAKLFETVKVTDETDVNNGISEKYGADSSYLNDNEVIRETEKETRKISLDCLDGEYKKKPSYVGVSCSNSGYRNVINYDSKLREGFWTARSQRESLVLSSSRLRESSPLRLDFNLKSQSEINTDSVKITDIRIGKESTIPVNGIGQPEKFLNISTSTKTISTFRNSKDIKGEGFENDDSRVTNKTESKVNLKQILNGKNEEPYRKGYSNLGFSPKILKSPEKNCNSFLKSISSFENNIKKSQTLKTSARAKTVEKICDSHNSILQRIERLYGPGALAQVFYTQKASYPKTEVFEKSDSSLSKGPVDIFAEGNTAQIPVETSKNSTAVLCNFTKTPSLKAEETVKCFNNHVTEEPVSDCTEGEKNGHYYLRLLKKETDHLEQLASFAESELENNENLPDDISGKLRAAAGKARLLMCQKLRQFEGLCHKNLNEKPEEQFPTTSEDLAGFWDMVMIQIVQVYGIFDELEELKKNNWKVTPTKKAPASPVTNGQSHSVKTVNKKLTMTNSVTEKQSQKSESVKKAREEERRKLLEEKRKKMKELKENKIINGENEIEIFSK